MKEEFKKLIFIDNDRSERANEDVESIKNMLELNNGFTEDYVETIEVVPDFHNLGREKCFELLTQENTVVCSFSMYTVQHHGSLFQLVAFLTSAGRYDIQDKVFVDGSGKILESMKYAIDHSKEMMFMLRGIENNFILTVDRDDDYKLKRLKVRLSGLEYSFFELVELDVKSVFKIEK